MGSSVISSVWPGLAAIIAALAKQVPFGFLIGSPVGHSVVWNVMLVAIWGLIHTGMARDAFKSLVTRMIPEPAERATYVVRRENNGVIGRPITSQR